MEQELILPNPFSKGLRPKPEFKYEPSFLSLAKNVYATESGAIESDKFTRSFALNESAQIFPTSLGIFVLTSTKLYSSTVGGALTELLTGLTAGGLWSCGDFGKYLVFTNGAVNLVRNITTGVFATDTGTVFPLAKTLCRFRGRLALGGPINYPVTGDWSNRVAVSDIGSKKFANSTNLDVVRQNLSANFTMSWSGQVLRVMPLGHPNIIVYGDNGISALVSVGQYFRLTHLSDIGIKEQGAVCSNGCSNSSTAHYFVDKAGYLCIITPDLAIKRLDYREYMA